jgi:hypothetical protein
MITAVIIIVGMSIILIIGFMVEFGSWWRGHWQIVCIGCVGGIGCISTDIFEYAYISSVFDVFAE